MRKDKEFIFNLRREGKSYRDIQKQTGVSRATLCAWFRHETWSNHITIRNAAYNHQPEQTAYMRSVRSKKLGDLYKEKEQEAAVEYETFKKEPLFWAGLMAYAGEGDKRSKNLVRVTNSEFYIHRIFLMFAAAYLKRQRSDIKFALILYPDHNESLCKEMWSNLMGIGRENFYKTQIIKGKELRRRLQYGVGMSIISSAVLKRKMLKWLSLAQDERFDAIIV